MKKLYAKRINECETEIRHEKSVVCIVHDADREYINVLASSTEMLDALEVILDRLSAWRDDAQTNLENCEPHKERHFLNLKNNYSQLCSIASVAIQRTKK